MRKKGYGQTTDASPAPRTALVDTTADSDDVALPPDIQAAAEDMPSVSPILDKIHRMSREMEISPRELVKIIMLDPTLTAQVLKLVNSSFYGLACRVSSLAQAVVLLGINTVKNLAVTTALLSTVFLRDRSSPLHPEAFWRHCLGTATLCRMLARTGGADPETAELYFIAGMLHDIGKILFIKADPVRYARAMRESRCLGVCLYFAERAHFGCTHAQAGAFLARTWNLDPFLTEAIQYHHSRILDRASLVVVGNNFCKKSSIGDSGDAVIEEHADAFAMRLEIPDALLSNLFSSVTDEIEKAATFLCRTKEELPPI